jgi:hypothetical protein
MHAERIQHAVYLYPELRQHDLRLWVQLSHGVLPLGREQRTRLLDLRVLAAHDVQHDHRLDNLRVRLHLPLRIRRDRKL